MLTRIKEILQGKVTLKQKRSSRWPKLRLEFLKENTKCAVCSGTKKLEVHHIKPFSKFPELELDKSNLIVLCEAKRLGVNCHQLWGHLGNWKKINEGVVEDARAWQKKLV